MVAVDEEGRPAPIPPLRATSSDERRREAEAQLRRTNRLAEREQIVERRRAEG
jgi:acyl-CoA hydrolase